METLRLKSPVNMNNFTDNLLLLFVGFLNIPVAFIMDLSFMNLNFIIGCGSAILMVFRNRAIIGVSIYEIVVFIFNRKRRTEIYKIWRAQLRRTEKQQPESTENDNNNDSNILN